MLKNLTVITILCTLLSVPAYVLFWSGRSLNNPDSKDQEQAFQLNTYIASLSLANLGEASFNILELPLDRETAIVKMFCETGVIGRLSSHRIARKVKTSDEIEYYSDSFCDVEAAVEN